MSNFLTLLVKYCATNAISPLLLAVGKPVNTIVSSPLTTGKLSPSSIMGSMRFSLNRNKPRRPSVNVALNTISPLLFNVGSKLKQLNAAIDHSKPATESPVDANRIISSFNILKIPPLPDKLAQKTISSLSF